MRLCLVVATFVVFSVRVTAAAAECFDASAPQKWVAERHGSWEKMSADQWQLLRGISAVNSNTPPGIPFGDAAALVRFPNHDTAEVVFLDGDQACSPMSLPKVLVDMLVLVGHETITHLGQGM